MSKSKQNTTVKSKKELINKSKKKKTDHVSNNNWEHSLYYRLAKLAIEDLIIR